MVKNVKNFHLKNAVMQAATVQNILVLAAKKVTLKNVKWNQRKKTKKPLKDLEIIKI